MESTVNILVLGGTRNLGTFLVPRLLEAGHRVAVLNRGRTADTLPRSVERLRADRSDRVQLEAALGRRRFDAVIDLTLYTGADARLTLEVLDGRADHYVFISSGQVYLVRDGAVPRPFREIDYEGALMPEPTSGTYDVEEWRYGVDKRAVEDVLAAAGRERSFPYTTLRLPMVNGERDHFFRIYNYMLRLKDGGPILVPTSPRHPLRHVYSGDVVEAIATVVESGRGKGRAYNVSQDETVPLPRLLEMVAERLRVPVRIQDVPRETLVAQGLLPDASPFSEVWMSELDNALGKSELGLRYTPLPVQLDRIVASYESAPPPLPESYRRRAVETSLAGR
jgi:nucleoside-diphosphate-sugar epimerase